MRKKGELEEMGMRIRMWRKDRGLRANELARKLKISGGSLSEIENGKSFPSAPTLASMHLNTDLNVGYVLTGQAAKNLKKTPRTLLVEIDANIDHVVLKNRKNA